MRRLGLIVRADSGGLGTQTYEMWRHLKPEATLLVTLPRPRGPIDLDRYPGAIRSDFRLKGSELNTDAIHLFVNACDVILSVESFYDPRLVNLARQHGVELVLYVNPELFPPNPPTEYQADRFYASSDWRADRLDVPLEVLPQPVALDRFDAPREATEAATFVHLPAPAMLDRNGTEALIDALPMVRFPSWLGVLNDERRDEFRRAYRGHRAERYVLIEWPFPQPPVDYPDLWAVGDCLVLPRRYGGTSLPMLEAAAAGMAVISTDVEPQRSWLPPELLCRVLRSREYAMKGGMVLVHQPDPSDLARVMNRLAASPEAMAEARASCRTWAESQSWEKLGPAWEAALR